jgi:hypothetical protein
MDGPEKIAVMKRHFREVVGQNVELSGEVDFASRLILMESCVDGFDRPVPLRIVAGQSYDLEALAHKSSREVAAKEACDACHENSLAAVHPFTLVKPCEAQGSMT